MSGVGVYNEEKNTIAGSDLKVLTSAQLLAPSIPPILLVGGSGAGKTYTSVDFLYALGEQPTAVIFMTNSAKTSENAYLRKHIPVYIMREFDVEVIISYWNTIKEQDKFYQDNTDPTVIDEFINKNCKSTPKYQNELNTYITKQKTFDNVFPQLLKQYAKISVSENIKRNLNAPYDPKKIESASDNDKSIMENIQKARELNLQAFNMKYIATNFISTMDNISEKERNIISACRSTRPRVLWIFDDVTAALSNTKIEKDKITFESYKEGVAHEVTETKRGAFNYFFKEALTRGRHYGKMVFAVHGFDTIPAEDRRRVGPIVISTATDIQQLSMIRTNSKEVSEKAKRHFETVNMAITIAEQTRKPYRFKLVYFPESKQNIYDEEFAILKVNAHSESKPFGCKNFQVMLNQTLDVIKNSPTSNISDDTQLITPPNIYNDM